MGLRSDIDKRSCYWSNMLGEVWLRDCWRDMGWRQNFTRKWITGSQKRQGTEGQGAVPRAARAGPHTRMRKELRSQERGFGDGSQAERKKVDRPGKKGTPVPLRRPWSQNQLDEQENRRGEDVKTPAQGAFCRANAGVQVHTQEKALRPPALVPETWRGGHVHPTRPLWSGYSFTLLEERHWLHWHSVQESTPTPQARATSHHRAPWSLRTADSGHTRPNLLLTETQPAPWERAHFQNTQAGF